MKRWFLLVALAVPLVAAGCGITAWSLASSSAGSPGDLPGPDLFGTESAGRMICFGYVDGQDGVRALAPLKPGRVIAVKVREGDEVAAGTVLLQLEDSQARHALTRAELALEIAKDELKQAEESAAKHQTRVKQQEAVAGAAAHRLGAAQQMLSHKRELVRRNQVPPVEAAVAEEQVGELEATHRAEQARLEELKLHHPETEVRLAEGKVKSSEAALLEAREALDDCSLKAPEAGTVLRILVGVGDVLGSQSRESVVQFVAAGQRVIRAEIAHQYASHVFAGQPVQVTDEFDSRQSWSAHIVRVSDWYTRRRSVLFEPGQVNDVRTLECVIKLDSIESQLRLGQRVRVAWDGKAL